jgi:hypothetical protein
MYLKFGFGRATQDAGIEIRRGALSREAAINLVKLYDGGAQTQSYNLYCEYFNMNIQEFQKAIDGFVNLELFRREGGDWSLINPAF